MHTWSVRLALLALTLHSSHFTLHTFAQRPPAQPNAAEILHRMQKLNVLGSVLYIVAHPDDENTRLIAWLANGKKVRTGNLSLTRGDGGQNLIGPELGDALGIIRTQELLEARRIDGGEQFFTRAVDFGYSKNAAESFEKWGKQEVLSDVVRVIRMFRPDVIITRFAPDRSAGHGHHEASAILAEEAFDLAGDPKAFPEQLEQGLELWQPRRLFFNGSTWWKKDLADIAKTDPDWFSVDVGGYDPLLGLSYTEIAGRSRSMHKSQGFGAAETRGEMLEYLKFIKGDRPKTKDIFEGIDMTWGRVKDGTRVSETVDAMISEYDPYSPQLSMASLDSVGMRMFRTLGPRWQEKQSYVDELRKALAGVVYELVADKHLYAINEPMNLEHSLTARLPLRMEYEEHGLTGYWGKEPGLPPDNRRIEVNQTFYIKETRYTSGVGRQEPLWLKSRNGLLHSMAMFSNDSLIQKDPTFQGYINLRPSEPSDIQYWKRRGTHMHCFAQPVYKWVDRVAGERIRPVYVTPVASISPKHDQLLLRENGEINTVIELGVEIEALTDSLTGELMLEVPGWHGPLGQSERVSISKRGESQTLVFRVNSADLGPRSSVPYAKFSFSGPKGTADRTLHEIDYPHIMPQVYYTPAEVKLVPLDVTTTAKRVGYVKGAGDEVPQALEQLGVVVEFIDASTGSAGHLSLEELKKYDAIVTGIRAYNATKGMKELHPLLLQYVEQGGTLIVQYNTTPRFSVSGVEDFQIDPATLGPHPFKITRDRVTVEEAPPTFLDPKHPLLTTPNAITAKDFEGWVQERGLYFAGELGDKYTPLIAWNDPGEQPLNGGLISCDHGQGRFIYTGISFFRQLPAGVPGAYRLFANLISPRRE